MIVAVERIEVVRFGIDSWHYFSPGSGGANLSAVVYSICEIYVRLKKTMPPKGGIVV
jgi:hypothetical protein